MDESKSIITDENIEAMVNLVRAAESYADAVGCSMEQATRTVLQVFRATQQTGQVSPLVAAVSKAVM